MGKRTVILLFVALFAVVASIGDPLIAAYASAILGLTVVLGLMTYSAVVTFRNWQLEHHFHLVSKASETMHRRAA